MKPIYLQLSTKGLENYSILNIIFKLNVIPACLESFFNYAKKDFGQAEMTEKIEILLRGKTKSKF
jgi:hypothetical protein